ncbi:MAG: hypothetical protein IIV56_00170, partial [Mailhella sp.]|nr:hypothetical protein [Mailhella sp.]
IVELDEAAHVDAVRPRAFDEAVPVSAFHDFLLAASGRFVSPGNKKRATQVSCIAQTVGFKLLHFPAVIRENPSVMQ